MWTSELRITIILVEKALEVVDLFYYFNGNPQRFKKKIYADFAIVIRVWCFVSMIY